MKLLISTGDKLLISAGTMVVWDFDGERVACAVHLVLRVKAVCRMAKPWRKPAKTRWPRRIAGNSDFRDCLPRPYRPCCGTLPFDRPRPSGLPAHPVPRPCECVRRRDRPDDGDRRGGERLRWPGR